MARQEGGSLGSLTSVSVGTAVDVRHLETVAFQLSGTFVGTGTPEISQDGTNWSAFGTALTAPGVVLITVPCQQIRFRCTAFTSGTLVATYGGADQNRRG